MGVVACRTWKEEVAREQERGSMTLQTGSTATHVYKETSKTIEDKKSNVRSKGGRQGHKNIRHKQVKTGKK